MYNSVPWETVTGYTRNEAGHNPLNSEVKFFQICEMKVTFKETDRL